MCSGACTAKAWSSARTTSSNAEISSLQRGVGSKRRGTLFRLTLDGGLTTLHSFQVPGDEGWFASNPLAEATDGEFLGTAAVGSTGNQGAVYRLRITPALGHPPAEVTRSVGRDCCASRRLRTA